jgi:hypothetical protein
LLSQRFDGGPFRQQQLVGKVDVYIFWQHQERINMTLCELSPIECRSSLGLTTSISPSLTAHRQFKNGCQTNKERWIMKFGLTAFFSVMTCLSGIPPNQ